MLRSFAPKSLVAPLDEIALAADRIRGEFELNLIVEPKDSGASERFALSIYGFGPLPAEVLDADNAARYGPLGTKSLPRRFIEHIIGGRRGVHEDIALARKNRNAVATPKVTVLAYRAPQNHWPDPDFGSFDGWDTLFRLYAGRIFSPAYADNIARSDPPLPTRAIAQKINADRENPPVVRMLDFEPSWSYADTDSDAQMRSALLRSATPDEFAGVVAQGLQSENADERRLSQLRVDAVRHLGAYMSSYVRQGHEHIARVVAEAVQSNIQTALDAAGCR